jgi:hypothetical protein
MKSVASFTGDSSLTHFLAVAEPWGNAVVYGVHSYTIASFDLFSDLSLDGVLLASPIDWFEIPLLSY